MTVNTFDPAAVPPLRSPEESDVKNGALSLMSSTWTFRRRKTIKTEQYTRQQLEGRADEALTDNRDQFLRRQRLLAVLADVRRHDHQPEIVLGLPVDRFRSEDDARLRIDAEMASAGSLRRPDGVHDFPVIARVGVIRRPSNLQSYS